ncbi:MAG: glycosyltransferase [Bacteroidetes bacterium]|nr:glycosyltransferase [Bacteroidota bacterium]
MKRVLLIGSELGKGGAERSISLLSYYLQQTGYDVTLAILSGKDREKFYKTCDKVVFIDPPEHNGIWGKIQAWRYRLSKVKALKKETKADVSISFLEGPDYVNAMTKGSEKVVLSIRGSKMHDKVISGSKGQLRKKVLIPVFYRKADEIVCVTNALADEMQRHFGISANKLRTIYNFYEREDIIARSNDALTADEAKIFSKPVIITSGRLHVAKEHDKLIRILQKLKHSTDARLMILGDGELREPLIKLCEQLGLKPYGWNGHYEHADVYFMGFQQNAFKFYRHSRLFALASSWEGFPNVLAEALICHIPVVSTDCYTGPREILDVKDLTPVQVTAPVRGEVGSLMPMLDTINEEKTKLWAKEIEYWLNASQPDEAAFEKLLQRFTLDAMLQQWKAVIEN